MHTIIAWDIIVSYFVATFGKLNIHFRLALPPLRASGARVALVIMFRADVRVI